MCELRISPLRRKYGGRYRWKVRRDYQSHVINGTVAGMRSFVGGLVGSGSNIVESSFSGKVRSMAQ